MTTIRSSMQSLNESPLGLHEAARQWLMRPDYQEDDFLDLDAKGLPVPFERSSLQFVYVHGIGFSLIWGLRAAPSHPHLWQTFVSMPAPEFRKVFVEHPVEYNGVCLGSLVPAEQATRVLGDYLSDPLTLSAAVPWVAWQTIPYLTDDPDVHHDAVIAFLKRPRALDVWAAKSPSAIRRGEWRQW